MNGKVRLNFKRLRAIIISLLLVFSFVTTNVVPAYAAGSPETVAKKTTKKKTVKKPKIKKNSALYKTLTKGGLFDAEYYAASNPDVAAACGGDYNKLLSHFLSYGIYEGRQCNQEFNVNAYSSAYTDLQTAFSNSNTYNEILSYYNHYITCGKSEGRSITTLETAAAAGVEVKIVGTSTTVQASAGPSSPATPVASSPAVAPSAPAASAPTQPAPAPSTPVTPSTPEVPETPSTPEVPEVPETPSTPEVPETPAHTHSYTETITKAATHSEAGEKTFLCSCGDSYTEGIPVLTCESEGHGNTTEVCISAEDCTNAGAYKNVCADCGDQVGDSFTKEALGHNYVGVVTTSPTKTSEGVKTFTCSRCNDSYTENIAMLKCDSDGHGNTTEVCISAEDCTNAGAYKNVCDDCGEQVGDSFTKAALGHNYVGAVTTSPTKTSEGVKTFTCSSCNDSYTENIAMLKCESEGHGNTIEVCISTEDCINAGTYKNVCEDCGDQIGDSFTKAALGHNYVGVVTTSPTKTSEGVKTFTCSSCNDSYTENIAMLKCDTDGHGNTTEVCISAEDCINPGTYKNVCEDCGKQVGATFKKAALGHNYIDHYVKRRAVRNIRGIIYSICSRCGYAPPSYRTEPFVCTADSHYGFEVVSNDYSGTERYKNYRCTLCGANPTSDSVSIKEINGDTLEIVLLSEANFYDSTSISVWSNNAATLLTMNNIGAYTQNYPRPLTCKDIGYHYNIQRDRANGKDTYLCGKCYEVFDGIDPTLESTCQHSTERSEVLDIPSLKKEGSLNIFCATCNKYLRTETIPVLTSHVHNYDWVVKAPTCISDGLVFGMCSCGAIEYNILSSTSKHSFDEGETIIEPTCTTQREIKQTCKVCGKNQYVLRSALGHHYVETSYTPSTCAAEGTRVKTCDRCQDEITETISKSGKHTTDCEHPYVITAPTCASKGLTGLKCSVCGKQMTTYETNKLPHNLSWVTVQEMTYSQDEIREYRCSECGYVASQTISECEFKKNCSHENTSYILDSVATCSEASIYLKVCDICSSELDYRYLDEDERDLNNHTYDDGVVTLEATKLSVGEIEYTCTGCGATKTETTPKIICNHFGCKRDYATIDGERWAVCTECNGKIQNASDCTHPGSRVYQTIQKPSETQNGIYNKCCYYCGEIFDVVTVHAYKEYAVEVAKCNNCNRDISECALDINHTGCDLGYEEYGTYITTEYVTGWLETDYNETTIDGANSVLDHSSFGGRVFDMLNEYRAENEQKKLEWNWIIQNAADTRAIECARVFDHTRPNGQKWNSIYPSQMFGENIAIGYTTADKVMTAWKNSTGHNRNMLYDRWRSVAIGVFHKYQFFEGDPIPSERICWSQEFSYHVP